MKDSTLLFLRLVIVPLCVGGLVHASPDNSEISEVFSLDELLSLPVVRDIKTDAVGRIAWVEQKGGTWNIFLAGAPDYHTKQLTNYQDDDGQPISLVGFVPGDDEIVFWRGRPGLNPAHSPDPVEHYLLRLSLKNERITRLDKPGIAIDSPVLSPDGHRVLAVNDGEVWSYPLKDKAKPERLFAVRGKVGSLLFSPDGSKLAFISDRSIYKRGKYSYVGVFDINKHTITYMEPGVGIDQSIAWSPDGTQIAFIRFGYEPRTWRFSNHREGAPFSVIVADAHSGEGKAVFSSQPGYGSRFNGFRASGYSGLGGKNNLLWLADDTLVFPYEKTGWKLLYGVSSTGGKARLLTPGQFEIDGVTLSPDRTKIVYWSNSENDLHRLDLYQMTLANDLKPERIGKSVGKNMRYNARLAAQDTLLYRHAGASIPERLMVKTAQGNDIQLSTGPKPGDPITTKALPAEIVTFQSIDGMEIPAILYRPETQTGKGKHPVIVHVHGGSRYKDYPVWHTFFGHPTVLRYYMSRGYYVLSVNYRSGTGYGLDFREPKSYGGRGAGDVQDIIAAATYLKKTISEIDPDRIIIYGHSYGGHLVSNTLARSDVYAAGIDSAGVGDWVVEMEKDFNEVLQFNIPQRMVLEQLAYDSSAISKIDQWGDEPILFLHGDNDGSAAMQQTLELYLALQRRGKKVDALIMPGETHGILLRRNQVRYMRKIDTFLKQTLH